MTAHKPSQGYVSQAPVTYESVIPNPNLKLLDQMREVLRLQRLNIEHRTSKFEHRTGRNSEATHEHGV